VEGNVFSVVLAGLPPKQPKKMVISVLPQAAKPPKQPKKMVISLLPQAEKPVMRPVSTPTA
jgi:hypothetical protein